MVPESPETEHASVTFMPGMRSGAPCVNGKRIPIDMVGHRVLTAGVAEAMYDWDLTRCEVLTVCWYLGTYGIDGHRTTRDGKVRVTRGPRPGWRAVWGEWAYRAHDPLWSGLPQECPDPPTLATDGPVR